MGIATKRGSSTAAILLTTCLLTSGCVPDDLLSGCCVVSTPTPPAAPITPNATVGAVAQPTLGNSPPPAVTIADVERVENSTVDETIGFRLIQSARTVSLGSDPKSSESSTETNAGGATLFIDYPADPDEEVTIRMTLGNSALGVNNVTLTPTASGQSLQGTLGDGRSISVVFDSVNRNSAAGEAEFNWTGYGGWGIRSSSNVPLANSPIVGGVETTGGAVPNSGSATFTGFVQGTVVIADGTNLRSANLLGNATIIANFASGSLTGSAPSIMATPLGNLPLAAGTVPGTPQAWNGLNFAGTFATGVNGFTGTTSVSSAPGNSYSLLTSATGFLAGRFYGPGAEELGAVWNVTDGKGVAQGVLVGGR